MCRYFSKGKRHCANGSSNNGRKRQCISASFTQSSSQIPHSVLGFSSDDSDIETSQLFTNASSPPIPESILTFSYCDSDEEPSQPCTGVTEAVVTDHDTHVILETTAVSVEPVIPQTVLDQHCCDSDVSVSQSSTAASQLTASSLKCLLNDIDSGSFLCVESSRYVTFVQLTDELVPAVRIAFVIDENCAVHISVSGKPIDEHHTFWQQVPKVVSSKDDVVLILYVLSKANVCSGSGSVNLFNESILKNTSSYVEQQSSCVRSTNCSLLSGDCCKPCSKLKQQLRMRKRRQLKYNDTSSNLPNKFLSSPFIRRKLTHLGRMAKQLKHRNNSLHRQLKHYKRISKNVVINQGQKLTESDSSNMMQLATECTDAALKQFPPGSFQRIFWKQQLQYNKMKNKSNMRWHPTMIRWCLYLKSKSAKAYEGVRAYLNLPCSRTLYDYSHYMEHKLGVNPKVVEQLIQLARKKAAMKLNTVHLLVFYTMK